MKDRVRIMLGNQEIVKRYIGSRLVWEAVKKTTERLLLKIMQKKSLSSPPLLIIYTTNKNTPAVLTPNKIQADDKQPINLDSPIVGSIIFVVGKSLWILWSRFCCRKKVP